MVSYLYWFESVNRLIRSLSYYIVVNFVLNCTLNNNGLILLFFFREKVIFIHFNIIRVLELVDRTNLSFVDVMS
jgi:hypothetical protein